LPAHPGGTPSALGCASGDGAIVLAINKRTGQVVWRTKADTHPSSKITGSISGHDNMIFVPVGNWEEDWGRAYPNIYVDPVDPASHYPCCSAREAWWPWMSVRARFSEAAYQHRE